VNLVGAGPCFEPQHVVFYMLLNPPADNHQSTCVNAAATISDVCHSGPRSIDEGAYMHGSVASAAGLVNW